MSFLAKHTFSGDTRTRAGFKTPLRAGYGSATPFRRGVLKPALDFQENARHMPTITAKTTTTALAHEVTTAAYSLTGAPTDFDPLLALINDASYVLIGEASHGTHEFYRVRGEITKRLIHERGFTAVAGRGGEAARRPGRPGHGR